MQINLFDPATTRVSLLPFTYTRPVAEIRVGILKISEKWQHYGFQTGFITEDYLSAKYAANDAELTVNGALCPTAALAEAIGRLQPGEQLQAGDDLLAANGETKNTVEFAGDYTLIRNPWDIFRLNRAQIEADFPIVTKGRKSQPIEDPHTVVYGAENLFVEEGASIRAAVINAESGPVYIGKNTRIHEGTLIKGALALCEGSHINMGAKLKGDSTIGPHCKVGGEVSNSVIFGRSNKGHDGYLGNSVIGEWCNLGADTNTSNLKNNYASVKLWNYAKGGFADSGLQFCGLMMGDHAKCGINTMFNTGTVVGVGANIFGPGFPRNFVPSFAWGGANGFITFQPRKFYEVAKAVMQRRSVDFDEQEKEIIDTIYAASKDFRIWDKK